jgi:hypothetical protein
MRLGVAESDAQPSPTLFQTYVPFFPARGAPFFADGLQVFSDSRGVADHRVRRRGTNQFRDSPTRMSPPLSHDHAHEQYDAIRHGDVQARRTGKSAGAPAWLMNPS